jgi:hypothetical protein
MRFYRDIETPNAHYRNSKKLIMRDNLVKA